MKKLLLLRGMDGVRALAAFLMVAGVLATGARTAVAQDDESGLDGNTFTGPNFGWSVEWDEDVWTFETENNEDGSDLFQMTTVDEEGPFAIATFFAGEGYNGDPDDCVAGYADTLAGLDGNSDVAESDEFDLPETPDDGAATTYTYLAEIDSGDLDLVDYVSCQTLVEDEAVLNFSVTTTPNVFEDLIPIIDDLTAAIILPDDSGSTGQDDEDVTPDADEDEEETPDADEEDDEEETPESDEEDAEPTRDVLLGDDEDETPDADDDEPQDDSGVDDTTYTSPTYGYAVEWDDATWAPDPADELIDDGSVGLDRLLLIHEDDDGYYSSFYVEGKVDYDGDLADCVAGEADLLSAEDAVVDFAPLEDESGDPVEGEADSGGEFAAFVATIETDDGTEVDLVEHVECQTLEDGESVVVFTLITSEDLYEDELDAAVEVIDTLELEGGSASDDDAAEDEDTGGQSADDDDAADDEPTEDADAEDDEPTVDGPADDAEPTEEPSDEEDTARAPLLIGFAG